MQRLELITLASATVAVFASILVVFWHYIFPGRLSLRVAKIVTGHKGAQLWNRQSSEDGHEADKLSSFRAEPMKLFQALVARLKLTKVMNISEIARDLQMAGFYGRSHLVTFLAARVIVPVAVFVLAVLYVSVIIPGDYSLSERAVIAAGIAGLGYYAPALYLKNKIGKRQSSIRRAWPDALDLMLICIECGMGVESAFERVAVKISRQSPELAEELDLTLAELAYLQDRRKAYENLANRTGIDSVRSVVTSLIQSEKYGTPLGQSLRVLSQESRDTRMALAEKKAASLPPKLTVPMIVFFLPVLFVVIISPAAIQIFTSEHISQ